MGAPELKFCGALLLVAGIGVFAYRDIQKSKEVDEIDAVIEQLDSGRPRVGNGRSEKRARAKAYLDIVKYQEKNKHVFASRVGSTIKGADGKIATLANVKYYAKGSRLGADCPNSVASYPGWYYETRSFRGDMIWELCGTSEHWDPEPLSAPL